MPNIVELESIPTMCVTTTNVPEGISDAVSTIEEILSHKLTGRKCYGVATVDEQGKPTTYRACVAIREGDDPASLGLDPFEIPGGKYARDRIRPWNFRTDVPVLIQKFEKMAEENERDNTRPDIEFYRRHDDLILYMPSK